MFGRWKRRFYILHSELRVDYKRAPILIACCAILHNIAVKHRLPDFEDGVEDVEFLDEAQQPIVNVHDDGTRFRNFIVNQFFN